MQDIFSSASQWIINELAHRRPIAESMNRLIDKCEAARPHADWEKFRSLPYDDLRKLDTWIQQVFRKRPPKSPLRGLWFGLFNPVRRKQILSDMNICGSERFVSHDMNAWAVDPEWCPPSSDANSSVLAKIYRIAYPPSHAYEYPETFLGNDAEYPLCLGYAAFAVREVLRRTDPTPLLGKSKSLGVAVAFHDGDGIVLGRLTSSGLRRLRVADKEGMRRWLRKQDQLEDKGDTALLTTASGSVEPWQRKMALAGLAKIVPRERIMKEIILKSFLVALQDINGSVRREARKALRSVTWLSARDLKKVKKALV